MSTVKPAVHTSEHKIPELGSKHGAMVPGDALEFQGGAANKNTGTLQINFPRAFAHPPVVTISPYWAGQGQEVGHTDTLSSVTTTGFTVVSANQAANYYVMWLAVANK
ncbi:H-type lectin domain-containing protein [Singulisphaera acidiphila]|uniref:H-type lectin domain protein n=1 Tax=Singulisphaera acidiphila (strain ATCC BAA-1392 / DSM 18658 / VKM B-2454 / MOB10) TaxID=886293 RepID=L0DII0_SINAD|nr:H-type lectin domain-containing protein [Singulisphaera acidiphila]AGA28446.1 H-type lectin domain protein [Singulisphaera acidiphila DSM 18658]